MADLRELNANQSKLGKSLVRVHGTSYLVPLDKGFIVDRITKILLSKFMKFIGMIPKKDYSDSEHKNSLATDFTSSTKADKILMKISCGKSKNMQKSKLITPPKQYA